MRFKVLVVAALALTATLLPAQKLYIVDARTQVRDGSEKIHGPRVVIMRNLNTLRYGYKLGGVETIQNPPIIDLSSLATGTTAKASSPAAAKAPVTPAKKSSTAGQDVLMGLTVGVGKFSIAPKSKPKGPDDGSSEVEQFTDKVNPWDAKLGSLYELVNANLISLANETLAVNGEIDDAEAAKASVKLGTADLTAMLQESDQNLAASTTAFVEGIQQHLAANSIFAQGVYAIWKLNPSAYSAEQQRIQSLANQLLQVKAELDTNLAGLKTLEKSEPDSTNLGINSIAKLADAEALIAAYEASIANWTNQLNTSSTDSANLLKSLATEAPDSTAGLAFARAQQQLRAWSSRAKLLVGAVANTTNFQNDPLAISYPVSCEFSFAGTQETIVSVTQTSDALSAFSSDPPVASDAPKETKTAVASTNKPPATVPTAKLITVECTTPIILAAGVGFSSIPEREFGIQQTGTTTSASGTTSPINSFVATANSSFHPLPLAAVHVRVMEKKNLSLLGTISIAANIKGQNSGGSNAEYLFGPTLGFARYAFITLGAHIGQETILGGGFKVGDTVPSGITTAPLQQSYRPGFGMAITFSK